MAKERYAGPPHLTEAQLIAQRKKTRGDGTIMKIGSVAQGFVEDVLTILIGRVHSFRVSRRK